MCLCRFLYVMHLLISVVYILVVRVFDFYSYMCSVMLFVLFCFYVCVVLFFFVYLLLCFFFFFFKQKTAYEMRISDWSSDVCSSDLLLMAGPQFAAAYPLLLLLGIAASIDLIGVSFEPLLMATNHARKSVTIKLINAALLLCLLSILLPRFGLEGAAAANVVVALAGFFLMGWAAHRHAPKEPDIS